MERLNNYYEQYRNELLGSCVPFWLKHARDKINGGIYTCLDQKGEIYSTDKSVWMQGRAGYMFSYLYNNVEQREEFLTVAKSCIDFAKRNCIDFDDGRMFFTVTAEGKPLRKRRYWFSESFYCIANAEYYLATGDKSYLAEGKKYFDFIVKMYLDPQCDPYKITPKSYAQTRACKSLANPMILLNCAAILASADRERADYYEQLKNRLISDIRSFHSDAYHATLESVGLNGEVMLESALTRIVNPGHAIECSWFLLEEAICRSDKELADFAELMFNEAFERGWDGEYGGILYFKDVLGKPVEAYEHDMKLWWPHNEAIIASLMLYRYTKKQKYLDIFEKISKYAFEHFSDKEYGEWYGYLRRDGKPTEPPCKGHTYKGPFHVLRMLAKSLPLLKG